MEEFQQDEPVFEAERGKILAAALKMVPFDGWTPTMMAAAAADAGLDRATLDAAFPNGIADLLQFWSEILDTQMETAMGGDEFAALKIREKVAFAVRARLELLAADKEAARRAAATLALPNFAPLATRLIWRTADCIWRGLGDQSTDFNFYSKRAILSGVWTSTFAHWLGDESDDYASTWVFLDQRIENVMQIEKAKSWFRKAGLDPNKPIELLAKFRYFRKPGS